MGAEGPILTPGRVLGGKLTPSLLFIPNQNHPRFPQQRGQLGSLRKQGCRTPSVTHSANRDVVSVCSTEVTRGIRLSPCPLELSGWGGGQGRHNRGVNSNSSRSRSSLHCLWGLGQVIQPVSVFTTYKPKLSAVLGVSGAWAHSQPSRDRDHLKYTGHPPMYPSPYAMVTGPWSQRKQRGGDVAGLRGAEGG